jgi:hypothetical protein
VATYSLKSLQLLEARCLALAAAGVNPPEVVLGHTVAEYAFACLEGAEAVLREGAQSREP